MAWWGSQTSTSSVKYGGDRALPPHTLPLQQSKYGPQQNIYTQQYKIDIVDIVDLPHQGQQIRV